MDARVRYTLKRIEDEFLELLKTRKLSEITVTELCKKCEINRATFYKYYLDIYDLSDKLIDNLVQKNMNTRIDCDNLTRFSVNLLNQTKQFYKKWAPLGSENGNPELWNKLAEVHYKKLNPLMKEHFKNISGDKLDDAVLFFASGSEAIISNWLKNGCDKPAEEVTDLLVKLNSLAKYYK